MRELTIAMSAPIRATTGDSTHSTALTPLRWTWQSCRVFRTDRMRYLRPTRRVLQAFLTLQWAQATSAPWYTNSSPGRARVVPIRVILGLSPTIQHLLLIEHSYKSVGGLVRQSPPTLL